MPGHTLDGAGKYRLAALATVSLYLLAVAVAGPQGEFPLNDDWTYSRSAFALGSGQGLTVDEWSAPTLVGQTILGGLLVAAAGKSFLALRLLTVSLAAITIVLLFALFRHLEVGWRIALAAVFAFVFNPLYFSLSVTFMTEVPFLCFVALAVWLYANYLRQRRSVLLFAAGAVLGYAFLIRQTAVLFVIPLLVTILVEDWPGRGAGSRLRDTAVAASPIAIFAGLYHSWLGRSGGATPATMRKFTLLEHLTVEQLAGNTLGMFFYLSFLLLPLWMFLLGRIGVSFRDRGLSVRLRVALVAAFAGCAIFGVAWFRVRYGRGPYLPSAAYHAQMPFLLNILYDTGVGPVTLNPTYYLSPATPVYRTTWLVVTALTAVGSALLGAFVALRSVAAGIRGIRKKPMLLFGWTSFLLIVGFEIVFSHLQEGGLFDRHILTALLPFLVVVLEAARRCDNVPAPVWARGTVVTTALSVLLVFVWFTVAATHDYLAWNRVRWSLGRDLLASGADPLSVAGGFEFNAMQNYDRFRARGNIGSVYYWWFDRQDYLISMHIPGGYDVLRSQDYHSWVHRRSFPIFVLRKRG